MLWLAQNDRREMGQRIHGESLGDGERELHPGVQRDAG